MLSTTPLHKLCSERERVREENSKLTVFYPAVLDLLEHLGPNLGVAGLVLGHAVLLELDDLAKKAARVFLLH